MQLIRLLSLMLLMATLDARAAGSPAGPAIVTAETEKELEKARFALRSDSFNPAFHLRLARALYWNGRYEDAALVESVANAMFKPEDTAAVRSSLKTVSAAPKQPWQDAVALLLKDKKIDDAIAVLKKAVQLDHDDGPAFEKLALLYLDEKRERMQAFPYIIGHFLQNPTAAAPLGQKKIVELLNLQEKEAWQGGVTFEKIIALLKSPNGYLRESASIAAGKSSNPDLVGPLVQALDDDILVVGDHVNFALARHADLHKSEVEKKRSVMENSARPRMRAHSIPTRLYLLNDAEAWALVDKSYDDPDSAVRFNTMSQMEDRWGSSPLVKASREKYLAKEKDPPVLAFLKWSEERGTYKGPRFAPITHLHKDEHIGLPKNVK